MFLFESNETGKSRYYAYTIFRLLPMTLKMLRGLKTLLDDVAFGNRRQSRHPAVSSLDMVMCLQDILQLRESTSHYMIISMFIVL